MACYPRIWRLGIAVLALLAAPVGVFGQRGEHDFNRDWRFARGEQPGTVREAMFDDSGWEAVRLPHDWAIAGPFDASLPGGTGKLPWRGVGWYRKTFDLDAASAGDRVYFDFDGVMAFPKVYVNGQLAGEWDYGYISFRVDATPYVKFGEPNVIAVAVDTREHGSRWYPGAGIYRKVRMAVTAPVHIDHWGTFVTTPNVTDRRATVRVRTSVRNHTDAGTDVEAAVVVRDPGGRRVVSAAKSHSLPGGATAELDQQMFVANPKRWDIGKPVLYTVETTLRAGGEVVGRDETTFGFRTFRFDANEGFFLNGRRVQLKGVNLHHDHGPLGGVFNLSAMKRQLEIMRDMGVNALRTSHNPPAPEVLDLCDRMGIFVWDEAFDKWNATADNVGGPEAIKAHAGRQIGNLVKRDRNHPSVFVWSIGNEIRNSPDNKGDGKSFDRLESMRKSVLRHDTTRPVAIGCHIPETVEHPIYEPLDMTGWNYTRRYARIREMYPEKPILYSESASTVSTRGYYVLPLASSKTDYPGDELYVSSYDLSAVPWADIPDVEFDLMERDPFVGGEFVWTGFDYLGEPTPFIREARSSYFGIVDLAGIPKDRYYLYRSYWRPEETTVHILPHWNWTERVGKTVPVFVYTNGDSAELFLNGESLGLRRKGEVPPKPENLARGKAVTASSAMEGSANAVDGDGSSAWTADAAGAGQWLEVDLGGEHPVRSVSVTPAEGARLAGYRVQVSIDGTSWESAAETIPPAGSRAMMRRRGPTEDVHHMEARARYARVEFTQVEKGAIAGISELGVYAAAYEPEYYDVTYKYRLRWNDVVYEPGQLKAVAYKDGEKIGAATVQTAGAPARVRLTPERTQLAADGEDLAYILVEALDANGTLCPLADNIIRFEVDGPAQIAAVGSGDPMSLAPYQADNRELFFGKAMLILRSVEGEPGTIRIRAHSVGVESAEAAISSVR